MKEQPLALNELQVFTRRIFIIKSFFSISSAGLLWRLWNLQIIQRRKYKKLSMGNRIRLKALAAPRGIIYDQKGVILVNNIPSYCLNLIREDCPDIKKILLKTSKTLKIPYLELQDNFSSNLTSAKFQPIQIYENLTWYQMALINAYQEEFPGISIEINSQRYYPFQKSCSHFLGYVGKISASQKKKLPRKKRMSAKIIGKNGIEKIMNNQLIGFDGGVQIEVDSAGRKINTLKSISPRPGKDIQLTIDYQLQSYTEKLMENIQGAALIMHSETGEILAMVSKPEYDPNRFLSGLNVEEWQKLQNDPTHPLRNKCIQATYSPGSTFKMLIAIAALETGIIDENTKFNCTGRFYDKGSVKYCWKHSGHGKLNVIEALQHSCNVFFYNLALQLDIDMIEKYARLFGLGELTKITLPNEKSGLVPSKKWKKKLYNQKWLSGDTLSVGIGQGYITTTPLQLLNYLNIIINGGYLVRPKIIKNINHGLTKQNLTQDNSNMIFNKKKIDVQNKNLQIVREGMLRNVSERNGTGRSAYSKKIQIAGKTGTTQLISNRTKKKLLQENDELEKRFQDHGWFIGYAPADNPQVSAVLMFENGKGGKYAAPYVRKMLEYYFKKV